MRADVQARLVAQLKQPHPGTWVPTVFWHLRGKDSYDAWTLLANQFIDATPNAAWQDTQIRLPNGALVGKLHVQLWADIGERQGNKLDKLCATMLPAALAGYIVKNWS